VAPNIVAGLQQPRQFRHRRPEATNDLFITFLRDPGPSPPMIGMILVTHGRLAEELRSAMEHVVGMQRNVDTVCIGPDDDMENRRAEIEACIGRCDTGDGVVLLTDMFGGTPSNLAISMMERKGVEVIAGVNLPMLVKLAKVRSIQPLADAVNCAEEAGRKYIAAASHVLHGCKLNGSCG
jgi:mannose PTS system EIIA component